jgi:hypothetical protein
VARCRSRSPCDGSTFARRVGTRGRPFEHSVGIGQAFTPQVSHVAPMTDAASPATGLRLAGPGRSGALRGRTLAAPQRQKSRLQAKADGLSTKQTADQLDITDKAAEATFTRARVRMRRLADNFR